MNRSRTAALLCGLGLLWAPPVGAMKGSPFDDTGFEEAGDILVGASSKRGAWSPPIRVVSGTQNRMAKNEHGDMGLVPVVHTIGVVDTAAGPLWFKTGRGPEIPADTPTPDFGYEIDACLMDAEGNVIFRLYGGHSILIPECGTSSEMAAGDAPIQRYDPDIVIEATALMEDMELELEYLTEQTALMSVLRILTGGGESGGSTRSSPKSLDTCPNPPEPGKIKHVWQLWNAPMYTYSGWHGSPPLFQNWFPSHTSTAGFFCDPGNPNPARQDGLWPQWAESNHGRPPEAPQTDFFCEGRSGWRDPQSVPLATCDSLTSSPGGVPGPGLVSLGGGHNCHDDAFVEVDTLIRGYADSSVAENVCKDGLIRPWSPHCDGYFTDMISACF